MGNTRHIEHVRVVVDDEHGFGACELLPVRVRSSRVVLLGNQCTSFRNGPAQGLR